MHCIAKADKEKTMSLQVNDLFKKFGDKIAVDNISFEVTRSGVFGLIGTNGAGKTTTIRMILGILQPDSGSSTWNGKAVSCNTLDYGYLPEERGVYLRTKVLEQLIYFGMLRGMNKTDAAKSSLLLLDRLDISEYKNMTAEKLSKGNQQKVQIASTLVHNPKLIFLDEPFSGLDPLNAESLRNLISELVDEGKFIIMSSHQMKIVEEYCEDLVMLHRSKTILSGKLKDIKGAYGHTNLIIQTKNDISEAAKNCGLELVERRANEDEYKINGTDMANKFLTELISTGICPTKYEIKEPSLHEIFIEKAGTEE